MRGARAFDVAIAVGLREIGRTPSGWCIGPCPACGAERRHTRSRDHRGAIGIGRGNPRGWRCWQCEVSGDGIDLVAFALRGKRYRDLGDTARAEVREWCCRWLHIDGTCSTATSQSQGSRNAAPSKPPSAPLALVPPLARPVEDAAPTFPPFDEVRAVWDQAIRVDADPAVAAYLSSRGLDPRAVADARLARAIRPGAPLPAWARIGREPWTRSGHRLITPLRNAHDQGRSLIARSIIKGAERKSVAPRGHTRAGLVMGCPLARRVLVNGTHPSVWPADPVADTPFEVPAAWWPAERPLTIIIAEGEINFFSWATRVSDADACPLAVFGVVQGSWTSEVAARIANGSRVVLAQDNDATGDKYAARVTETLRGRRLEVRRWHPPRMIEQRGAA
jgi:hypothetical protein